MKQLRKNTMQRTGSITGAFVLERISYEVARDSLSRFGEKRYVKIVFSERGGHSYRHTETYQELLNIQGRSGSLVLNKRSIDWDTVHWKLMEPKGHKTSYGCQLADIVTSAFYQAADANRPKPWTTEYAEALAPLIALEDHDGARYCADHGVTLMPWYASERNKLTQEQKLIFRHYGYLFED
jgi:molybdenum-dependent DNA-binding transcriptional regulator ModE